MLRMKMIAAMLCVMSACTTVNLPTPEQRPEQQERFGSFTDKDARNAQITMASTQLADGSHVPWAGPYYVYDGAYWVDADSNSDVQSTALDVRGACFAGFAIRMGNGSTPVGGFAVQMSYDGTNSWQPVYLDANRVYGQNFSTFSGGLEVGVSSPAGEVVIYVGVESPQGYLRLAYDRDSGGAADTIDAFSLIRGDC